MTYVPLWCKSNYSFLEGASHPEELVDRAAQLGLSALTLTDRNGVYGVVRAFDQARKTGLPLILGAEVTVSVHGQLVLLAQHREGWAQLCTLLSLGHAGREKGQFGLTWAQVAAHAEGLVALWRPEPGALEPFDGLEHLALPFRGRLFGLVTRHRDGTDRAVEQTILQADRFGVVPVAAHEVLYHDPSRQALQDVVTCIRLGLRWTAAGTALRPNAEHALKTAEEFAALYADHPEWVARTRDVAALCRFSLAEIQYLYPEEGVPKGYSTAQWVRHLTEQGALGRYQGSIPAAVRTQLDKELDLIEELQYSGYFLTMWEIVQYCLEHDILCQGRGSAANSAVCFCLGITAIDPVRMNLLFERFLSKERAEPPDIDLDIEHHRREEVIQHMYARYGRHRAAMVANVVRYRSRSALREVGKVLGLSEVALDRGSKLLSHHEEGIAGALADTGLGVSETLKARLIELTGQLRNFPRHLSIHPGGFLLGSEALARIVPIENATMENRTVIQWDKTDVETMNLFKVDLLGLGALTHLDYAFRLLKAHHGRELTLATIPGADRDVFDMLCRGDSVGVFQIESRAQMSMLPRLKPRTYYDLVVEISLVRPGPITGGMVHPYLRRRQGVEDITYPHESLIPVLSKTLGIPLFQEQVMKLAMVAADYTPGEADQLRRDMAAWKQHGRIEGHRDRLIERMTAKGIAQEFAERVFDQIRGFGEYGFPESHAASFALIAYATAYLKYHHPDAFACALLNAWPMGFYSPATILGDAQRHGVQVRPVSLVHSAWDCTLEPCEGTPSWAVRMGLRYIKGLVKAEAEAVLAVRPAAGSPRLELGAWKARARVSTETWEKLAVAGALEDLAPPGERLPRRRALWQVLDVAQPVPLELGSTSAVEFTEPSAGERVRWDYASTGSSAHGHLLAQYRPQLDVLRFHLARQVNAMRAPDVAHYAGFVICRQMPENAKGVLFLTMEDETGMVNVVVWKKTWDVFRTVILTNPFLAVSGRVQAEEGVVHIMAQKFWAPEGLIDPAEVTVTSHNFH